MYLQKLTIENIRALKRFEMVFPEYPAGWHVIIGDNGAGKSTLIRAIALGLIGPNEVRAANPNFAEWLRKDAKSGSVELAISWDKQHDFNKGLHNTHNLTARVLLQSSPTLSGVLGSTFLVEAVADEHSKPTPDKFLWSSTTEGWFSVGFGPFRRFTGGDTKHEKVYSSSPRCGAHLSVFGEDVALTEALKWLQDIDYQQLKIRENRAQQEDDNYIDSDIETLPSDSESEVLDEVKQLWKIASRLQKSGLFTEAESILRQALVLTEKITGPNHPDVATSLSNLALLLNETHQLNEAESLMRRALAIAEGSYGPDSTRVATISNNLANLLQLTNQLTEAESLYRHALAIDETHLEPDHPNIAANLSNFASLLQATNRSAEAEPLMRRALALDEANFGPEHPKVAIRLNNLATLLQDSNRLAEAEPLMRRALAIDEASYGLEHPKVAVSLNNLATLLKYNNRLAEAELLLRRSLAITEASLGPDHSNVAISLNNLASVLQDTNRQSEAESLYRRALDIVKATFGPNHPLVATHLNNLATLLQDSNRLAEAEPLMRRALAIDEASYGLEHPHVAIRLNNLASLLQNAERLSEAEPLYERSLAIAETSLGPDHPSVAIRLNNLANLLRATNRLSEAELLYRRALAVTEASFGPNHPLLETKLNNLVSLLHEDGRSEEANELIQQNKIKLEALSALDDSDSVNSQAKELPIDENNWLAIQLRTFINGSRLLPAGTEFKGMSAEGPIFKDGNEQIIAITQLSDGFRSILSLAFELIRQLIRVYGLIAVFPPNGIQGVIKLPGVVLIDEVDAHLHPTWQTRIGQWFTQCFPQIQFIVTTHSPLICRAVTETTGSIWRLPTPGRGQKAEEVTGVERQRLRLGTVLDAYGTGLFGGQEVEQAAEATALIDERARLSAKDSVGKASAVERKRLRELQQLLPSTDAEIEY